MSTQSSSDQAGGAGGGGVPRSLPGPVGYRGAWMHAEETRCFHYCGSPNARLLTFKKTACPVAVRRTGLVSQYDAQSSRTTNHEVRSALAAPPRAVIDWYKLKTL